MKIRTAILMVCLLCSVAGAADWMATIGGNGQDDIVLAFGRQYDGYTLGVGGGIWRNDSIDSSTDITVGPFITVPFDIPGNPFGDDLTTFAGVSTQLDIDTWHPIIEFFAGGLFYADRKASPIIGARYNWITDVLQDTTDITSGFELYGGIQFRF